MSGMATKSLPSSRSKFKLTVPRCRHSHIYKCCQSLRRGNSVLEVAVFENVGKNFYRALTNGLESACTCISSLRCPSLSNQILWLSIGFFDHGVYKKFTSSHFGYSLSVCPELIGLSLSTTEYDGKHRDLHEPYFISHFQKASNYS
jgi:hypothetical protein